MATTLPTVAPHEAEQARPRGERRRLAWSRGGIVRRALLAADVAALLAAATFAQLTGGSPLTRGDAAAFVLLVPSWVVAGKLFGLYGGDERHIDHSTLDELVPVFLLATVTAWTLALAAHWTAWGRENDRRVIAFWVVAVVSALTARGLVRGMLGHRPRLRQRALILGSDPTGRLIARKLGQHPEYGVDAIGFVDEGEGDGVIGAPDDLAALVRELNVDRVIVAFANQTPDAAIASIQSLSGLDVYVDVVPRFFDVIGQSGDIHTVEGLPLIDLPPMRISRSSRLVKRTVDIAGAIVGLAIAAPAFLVIPFLIRRESPGPALFRQERLGEQMRPFTLLKFRTMHEGTDEAAHRDYIRSTMTAEAKPEANGLFKLDRGDAVTKTGAFLRRTSLDELPQLINVLRGDMSLVGPRPCLAYETQLFKPRHFERFAVPAGLTGLWQVTARGHSTFGEALDMDVAYVRGWSLALDLSLVLRTVKHLLIRKGTT